MNPNKIEQLQCELVKDLYDAVDKAVLTHKLPLQYAIVVVEAFYEDYRERTHRLMAIEAIGESIQKSLKEKH